MLWLDHSPGSEREHQMGSCSMVFCCYSLFLNLAAEDKRIQRLSTIKEKLENLPSCTEIKALLAAAIQHMTCCVCVFGGSNSNRFWNSRFLCRLSLLSAAEKKVNALVLSAHVFGLGELKRDHRARTLLQLWKNEVSIKSTFKSHVCR